MGGRSIDLFEKEVQISQIVLNYKRKIPKIMKN